ncbi:MAG: T9SS type A sorting domain-containing protein [Bacteroidota bacterium]
MNKIILFLLFTHVVFQGLSQEASSQILSAGGNTYQSGDLALSATVGETIIGTGEQKDLVLYQGFQQTFQTTVTSLSNEPLQLEVKAYPNPTTDRLTVTIDQQDTHKLKVILLDVNGRETALKKSISQEFTLDLSPYAAGFYLLQIIDESQSILHTLKIQKTY